ncbi:hypothetical protein ACFL2M_00120 [Patescibacteria group bacterium]
MLAEQLANSYDTISIAFVELGGVLQLAGRTKDADDRADLGFDLTGETLRVGSESVDVVLEHCDSRSGTGVVGPVFIGHFFSCRMSAQLHW